MHSLKFYLSLLFLTAIFTISGQTKKPEDFGYRHLTFAYKKDQVDVLIKSKKGEEQIPKPIFFFCQGSLPQPLIIYDEAGEYGVFPFKQDSLLNKYHLVIVGKPYVPLMAEAKTLGTNFTYTDSTGQFPKKYLERNLLSYYSNRNISIIQFLRKQNWVSNKQLVLAGHSEGSTIASKMASILPYATHLIYSGGNPMGRIMSIVQQSRSVETDTDSTKFGEEEIKQWERIIENNKTADTTSDLTYKTTIEFSNPPIQYLEKLKIPVLVCYGTKDWSAPFNDYLRVEMIRKAKKNFTFNAYIGTEHNYFPLTSDNKPNYEIFNWDKVAYDWYKWLMTK